MSFQGRRLRAEQFSERIFGSDQEIYLPDNALFGPAYQHLIVMAC